MWRSEGRAEFYMHWHKGHDSTDPTRLWWNYEENQRKFIPDKWHHIELHYKLNTPGIKDGIMEGWFDGEKAFEKKDWYFIGGNDSDIYIDNIYFSTFFGGNETYAPPKDQYAYFDEFIVSKNRIGYKK